MSDRIARRLEDATPRTGSIYPDGLGKSVEGRAKWALGNLFGLDQFGVNIAEIAPGSASALRHWHSGEDEFVYIVAGSPTLVTSMNATSASVRFSSRWPSAFPAGKPATWPERRS